LSVTVTKPHWQVKRAAPIVYFGKHETDSFFPQSCQGEKGLTKIQLFASVVTRGAARIFLRGAELMKAQSLEGKISSD